MIDALTLNRLQNGPLVSIIVPVYNVEKYLDRCVQSIISQTYKNIEVFLVDDGSPDNCGKMCDGYAEKYPFIHAIHQENAGQAAARNAAVKLVSGEYISFIDSDDFVEPEYIEYLLSILISNKADISMGGLAYRYEGKNSRKQKLVKELVTVLNAADTLIRMNYNQGCGAFACVKLFKKQLIIDHPFPEGQIYEDLAILYRIVGDCNRIAIGNHRIYYWMQRAGSTTRMTFDGRQFAGLDAAEEQIRYIEKKYPMALTSAKYRYTAKAIELMGVYFNSVGEKVEFTRLKSKMNKYATAVLHDERAKATMKLRILAVKLGYYPAKLVFAIHEKAKKQLF